MGVALGRVFCFFAPVFLFLLVLLLVFCVWLFLDLLLVEMVQYAYEPLFEHESGSDEGEPGEENQVRNTEWCQFNHLPDESTGGFKLDEVHNKLQGRFI